MIELRGVTRAYRAGGSLITAVSALDLDIAAREVVGLTGPSGSGKTTLLNLIGGLDRPTAGTIRVDGRDLATLSRDELARYRRATIGFVFQSFRLLAHLTARENVALARLLAGVSRADAEGRADELLARVGLAGRASHRPPDLSAGEQQRVALARALANRPAILLADEPTGNLDDASARSLLDLVDELRRANGLTVVVATHNAEVAARADRIVRLRAGRSVEVLPSA